MPNYKLLQELNSPLYNNFMFYSEKTTTLFQYDEEKDNEIIDRVSTLIDPKYLEIKYTKFGNIRYFVVHISEQKYGTLNFIETLSNEIKKLHKELYKADINIYNVSFNLINNENSFPSDVEILDVYLKEPGNLKDIHKNFPNVKNIVFKNLSNIKGNILGIIKMKNLKMSNVLNMSTGDYNWYKIMLKYVNSKDVLACQDELLENGLKDYAKL